MRCGMRYGCLSQKYYRLPVQNAVRNAILMFLPTHIQEVMHGSARGAMAMATAMKCKDEDDDFFGLLCGHFGLLCAPRIDVGHIHDNIKAVFTAAWHNQGNMQSARYNHGMSMTWPYILPGVTTT